VGLAAHRAAGGANYAAARKLTGMIRALRTSTQALVAGDFDRPIDIDCACEVGGLADSFRAMVAGSTATSCA
jgi:two-component system CheB/CheR fusion protein